MVEWCTAWIWTRVLHTICIVTTRQWLNKKLLQMKPLILIIILKFTLYCPSNISLYLANFKNKIISPRNWSNSFFCNPPLFKHANLLFSYWRDIFFTLFTNNEPKDKHCLTLTYLFVWQHENKHFILLRLEDHFQSITVRNYIYLNHCTFNIYFVTVCQANSCNPLTNIMDRKGTYCVK